MKFLHTFQIHICISIVTQSIRSLFIFLTTLHDNLPCTSCSKKWQVIGNGYQVGMVTITRQTSIFTQRSVNSQIVTQGTFIVDVGLCGLIGRGKFHREPLQNSFPQKWMRSPWNNAYAVRGSGPQVENGKQCPLVGRWSFKGLPVHQQITTQVKVVRKLSLECWGEMVCCG